MATGSGTHPPGHVHLPGAERGRGHTAVPGLRRPGIEAGGAGLETERQNEGRRGGADEDAELEGVSDIGEDYWDDMVPMNYKSGTTKFIMNRNINNADNGDDSTGSSTGSSSATASVGLRGPLKCPQVAEGEREILDGPNGPILVTKVAGSCYAVDATCPHLSLPMNRGEISADDKPTLTCSFHNSCFELRTGKCTKWVTGALGSENDVIAGIMGSVGSGKKYIAAYTVVEGEDGSLMLTSEVPESSKVAF
eukprot:CAMPEP_0172573152 /NCGR_PEP_ID=MMETSP1067-20121228/136044_1 /TAXON_ID=265564 ORGANISM="Thalassiosira punctigera, Strain Tpunct2005C2" /NCGR_SAMPLE_ID=MMETSP1067 /ASSEMBLY_ACC=CAM_ASM_000444 /LENGTH=250 /DNA_ID=CAMNT_0013365749 /DNA_START=1256 /DNA_END=2009 /DNA_ORIENTATION=+